jgi:purine/pyrimidine-nucleoside phosphorylase
MSPIQALETSPAVRPFEHLHRDPIVTHLALASSRRARHQRFMSSFPTQFSGVTVQTKANVYFDGNVVSHTLLMPDNSKKTLGLIRPGSYHFNTAAAERMEIVAGECLVTIDGGPAAQGHGAGTHFDVPANSGFTIAVSAGLCEYICSFLA